MATNGPTVYSRKVARAIAVPNAHLRRAAAAHPVPNVMDPPPASSPGATRSLSLLESCPGSLQLHVCSFLSVQETLEHIMLVCQQLRRVLNGMEAEALWRMYTTRSFPGVHANWFQLQLQQDANKLTTFSSTLGFSPNPPSFYAVAPSLQAIRRLIKSYCVFCFGSKRFSPRQKVGFTASSCLKCTVGLVCTRHISTKLSPLDKCVCVCCDVFCLARNSVKKRVRPPTVNNIAAPPTALSTPGLAPATQGQTDDQAADEENEKEELTDEANEKEELIKECHHCLRWCHTVCDEIIACDTCGRLLCCDCVPIQNQTCSICYQTRCSDCKHTEWCETCAQYFCDDCRGFCYEDDWPHCAKCCDCDGYYSDEE